MQQQSETSFIYNRGFIMMGGIIVGSLLGYNQLLHQRIKYNKYPIPNPFLDYEHTRYYIISGALTGGFATAIFFYISKI
jgi:hypothetical protein